MANKTYQARVQSKIDTSENWAKATNFVPLKGEICIYSDLHRMKVGDGTTKINDLDFENPVDTALSTTSTNPVQNKAVKAELDDKISKSGDTFTGTLTFSGDYGSAAIDLGQNGYIDSARAIYFSHDANGTDIGFYIEAAPPATDDNYASALFGGNESDEAVRLSGIAPPANSLDAANKQYVDNKVPNTTTSDNNKFLRVVNGVPTWVALTNVAEEGA